MYTRQVREYTHAYKRMSERLWVSVAVCVSMNSNDGVSFSKSTLRYNCERSEPRIRVGWCIALVYTVYICLYPWAIHLVPRGPPVNAQRANVRPAE